MSRVECAWRIHFNERRIEGRTKGLSLPAKKNAQLILERASTVVRKAGLVVYPTARYHRNPQMQLPLK